MTSEEGVRESRSRDNHGTDSSDPNLLPFSDPEKFVSVHLSGQIGGIGASSTIVT